MFESLTVERALISNPNDYDSIDNPVIVTVLYKSGMRTDFNDVRFFNETGDSLLFSLSSKIDGDNAVFIVKMDYVPAEGDIYLVMGYGDNLTPSLATTANAISKIYPTTNPDNWILNPTTFLSGKYTGRNGYIVANTGVMAYPQQKGVSGKVLLDDSIDYPFIMDGEIISRDTDFSIIFFYQDDNNYYEIYHAGIFDAYLRKMENGVLLNLVHFSTNIWSDGIFPAGFVNFNLTVTRTNIKLTLSNYGTTPILDYTGSIDIMGGGFGCSGYAIISAYDARYCLGGLGPLLRASEILEEELIINAFEEWDSKSLEEDVKLNFLAPNYLNNKINFCIRPLREDFRLITVIRGFGSLQQKLRYISQSIFKRDFLDNFRLVYTVPSLSSGSDSRIIFIISGTFSKSLLIKGLISYDILGLPDEDENMSADEGEVIEENLDEEGSFVVIIGDTTYV